MPTITVDAILFDMDGTLIDSTPGVINAWHTFGKDYNFDAETAIAATHGVRLYDSLRKWCGIEDDDKIKTEAVRFEREVIAGGLTALPGVNALLDQLRAGSTAAVPGWAIVTSATNYHTPRALDQAGIEPSVFTPVITANDVSHGKPHPAPYQAGAQALHVDPKNCLVVEDAVNGILSGKAAGARTLGLMTSTPRDVVAAAEPDWIVPDLTHVSAKWVGSKIEVTIQEEKN